MRKRGLLLCLALLLVLCQGCTWPGRKTVTIGGQSVTIDPNVPENTLDAADFSQQADGKVIYTGGKYLTGIDVSAHQGEINWKKVAKQVDFAMIQVGYRGYTEGKLAEDERFRENIQQALKYKLKVGVYFFSQAITPQEGMEEAQFVLDALADYDITYPVVFDWERVSQSNSRTKDTTGDVITACAQEFCSIIADAGYTPMTYGSPSKVGKDLQLSQLTDYPFWLAHYTTDWKPTSFQYHYDMWQYSSNGSVDGIEGRVDLNICLRDW